MTEWMKGNSREMKRKPHLQFPSQDNYTTKGKIHMKNSVHGEMMKILIGGRKENK